MSIYFIAEVTLSLLSALPVYWLLSRQLPRIRRLLLVLPLLYLAGVYWVVGLPNVTYFRLDLTLNLIPFKDMSTGLSGTLLNVVLFLPLGFFLPVLWQTFQSCTKTTAFGFFTSLAIELLQIFTFRATDINDLITNTLGTFLGWCLGRWAASRFPSLSGKTAKGELRLLFGSVILAMFVVQPLLLKLVYAFLL